MVVNVDTSETTHAGGLWKQSETAMDFSERIRCIVFLKWIRTSSKPRHLRLTKQILYVFSCDNNLQTRRSNIASVPYIISFGTLPTLGQCD
jgi:hypothetical protein